MSFRALLLVVGLFVLLLSRVPGPAMQSPIVDAWATYFGGSRSESGEAIAVDPRGNAYVLGTTSSPDFPAPIPLPPSRLGERPQARYLLKLSPSGALVYAVPIPQTPVPPFDVAVDQYGAAYVLSGQLLIKIDASGSRRVYELMLTGGTPVFEDATAFAVDATGHAVVVGTARLTSVGDILVRKFDPSGRMLYRKLVPGGRSGASPRAVAVDGSGGVYVAGQTASDDFPTTARTVQPRFNGGTCVMAFPRQASRTFTCPDVFLLKLDRRGELAYSTYFGGTSSDDVVDVAVDAIGAAYLVGNTSSTDLPLVNALQPVCRRGFLGGSITTCRDAFVAKVGPSGSQLAFSTFLGGSTEEIVAGIVAAPRGPVYVAGSFSPAADFPLLNAPQPPGGGTDGFVTAIALDGRLLWSTHLGGEREERIEGIALGHPQPRLGRLDDGRRVVHVVGSTGSPGWPMARRSVRPFGGETDLFWAQLTAP